MSIKKIFSLILIFVMMINLFACSKQTKIAMSPTPRKQNVENTEFDNLEQGILQNEISKVKPKDFKLTQIVYGDEETKNAKQQEVYNVMGNKKWVYGKTPISWVFIDENKQLVSNYKPNGSKKFAVTANASSGARGCFVPILSGTSNYSENFEGRFFCYDDTTKDPTNLVFSNRLSDLQYDGRSVEEILSKVMDLNYTKYGILQTDEGLVNVIYATDLDEIIKNYY